MLCRLTKSITHTCGIALIALYASACLALPWRWHLQATWQNYHVSRGSITGQRLSRPTRRYISRRATTLTIPAVMLIMKEWSISLWTIRRHNPMATAGSTSSEWAHAAACSALRP